MPVVKTILTEARQIISTPDKWMKEGYYNDDATCFCSIGAIIKAVKKDDDFERYHKDDTPDFQPKEFQLYMNALRELASHTPDNSIISFNDDPETTHEDVMKLFDTAIKETKL